MLAELERQQERYDSEITKEEDRARKIGMAESRVAAIKSQVHEHTQGALDSMRDPHRLSHLFAISMYRLKKGLDRVKLPESAAREFFEELAEEDRCVCGRPIDSDIRDAIRARAHRYLGSDDVSLLNTMKSDIEEVVGPSRTVGADALTDALKSLRNLVRERTTAENDLDDLRRDAEDSDPAVMSAKEQIGRLSEKQSRLEKLLNRLNRGDERVNLDRIATVDPARIFSIQVIRAGISVLDDQVAEITGTLNLRRKRDLLRNIVASAYKKARYHITAEIKDDTNARIATLMPNNRIRVANIDQSLILDGQPAGSAGENLSIAYAFLATLFNRSGEHQLPFVVDSPASPIDYAIRPRIGRLVPVLTGQFIAFVISAERAKFLPALRKSAADRIRYITLFRNDVTRYVDAAARNPGYIATSDGIQVVDERFFQRLPNRFGGPSLDGVPNPKGRPQMVPRRPSAADRTAWDDIRAGL